MAKNNEQRVPRRVLMTRFSALGDVAMTIPVVYDACRSNPDVEFVFITRSLPAQLFVRPPENLTVEGVNLDSYKGLRGLMRLRKYLSEKYNPDTLLDLHDVLRTKVLRFLFRWNGVKVYSLKKGRREKRLLTRHTNKVVVPLKTTVERYKDVFEAAFIPLTGRFVSLYEERPQKLKHPSSEKWIGIAPFAKHPGKIYPAEQMKKVVRHFGRRPDTRVFLFGAPGEEAATIASWIKDFPNCENMAAQGHGLSAELELMSRCDVLLTMDSFNMHMGALVGVPTLSIWGATHPYGGFMGWNQDEKDALQIDLVCRPCSIYGNRPCRRGDFLCLYGISPNRIISELEKRI